jgi:hypothetical protein
LYDNGSLVAEKIRAEIDRQQQEAGAEWTWTEFRMPWTAAHDLARIVDTLHEYADVKCRECKTVFDTSRTSGGLALKERGLCFDCNFWTEKVDWAEAGDLSSGRKVARVLGHHYIISPDQADLRSAGMGGRKCQVRFTSGPHAGAEITTRNLWFQGEIPDHFRDRLPDNAEFFTNEPARVAATFMERSA